MNDVVLSGPLLLAAAVAAALIVAWLARTVRAQALDAEYREEVR